ncbi:MAG: lyase family protein, partial [Actinomycetota bacterium]|nr:lyase family protein [Actinomycetota bacterium]
MSDLLWPGLHRADFGFNDGDLLGALSMVEMVWSSVLAEAGLVPASTPQVLLRSWAGPEGPDEDPDGHLRLTRLAVAAEGGGNPVIPVLAQVRARAREIDPAAAAAIHRGLTSQDVLDSALMLCVQGVLKGVVDELDAQVAALADLAQAHRETLMVARTLGQHALPTTFGARVAAWLRGLLVARDRVIDVVLELPLQLGGAAGTLAAVVDLCRDAGHPDPVASTRE